MKSALLAKAEKHISEFVPYTRFVDNKTLRTKDGYLLQIIKVHGISYETADTRDIEHYKDVRATLLQGINDPRVAIYHHIIRSQTSTQQDSFFENDFARELNNAYQEKLKSQRMYKNEQYITIVLGKPRGVIGLASRVGRNFTAKLDKKLHAEQLAEDHKLLCNITNSFVTTLNEYNVQVLTNFAQEGEVHSPALSFLSYLLNFEDIDHRAPRAGINEILPRKRLSFGKEIFEVRGAAGKDIKMGAMLGVKNYPNSSDAGMLDGLLKLPYEFVVTQSFAVIDKQASLLKIKDVHRKMQAGEEGAISLEDELENALDNVASGLSTLGEHHLSICITAPEARTVEAAISECTNALLSHGIIAVREDLNMESAFWAQLPANLSYIARKAIISNQNFSGFASLHNFPVGKKEDNHWGDAITRLETTSGTPYWFNFHERDVGNFTMFGPTGYGKTVLLSFLLAQSLKLNPKTFFFDKDHGAEIFLRAIGANYKSVETGKPTGLNPFQLKDTPENRVFLRAFLRLIIRSDNDFTAFELKIIADAVDANYDAPYEHRKLSVLSTLFGGFTGIAKDGLEARLAPWHSDGEHAWLFDNEVDSLSMDSQIIGFDMTSILDNPITRSPWLFYIFHRIKQSLNGQKSIIMLDEGWKLLDDPAFSDVLKDWLKTIRKQNGLVGFATQSVNDALKSPISGTILEQCPTQIFLPNPKARADEYCDAFHLTERELHIVRNLSAQSRCFLIKHAGDSVIARLDLSGMDDFINVLSGTAQSIELMNVIRAESLPLGYNDDPSYWLPIFMDEMRNK